MSVSIDTLSIEITANAGSAAQSLERLAKAMGDLGNNSNVTKAKNALTKLSTAMGDLSKANGTGIANLEKLAKAMQGLAGLGKIASFTPMINQLKKIPEVMAKLDDTTVRRFGETLKILGETLGPLSTKIDKVSRGLQTLPNSINRVNNSLRTSRGLAVESGSALDMMSSRYSGLAAKATAAWFVLTRVSTSMASWIQDTIQWDGVVNRFNYSFGEMSDSVYQHVQRVSDVMYINQQAFLQYSGTFASIARGFGLTEKNIEAMGVGLTEFTYDLYAYANDVYPTLEQAANAVRSAIVGEIEPIRRAGISITEASLKEKAALMGITQSYESLTDAQKSLVRYQAMVDTAMRQGVVGTYAREMGTAEGAVRMLEQQVRALTQALGSLFIPILNKVIPYITAFIQVVLQAVAALAALFGFKANVTVGGSSGLGGVGSAAGGAASGISAVGAAAASATPALMAYDAAVADMSRPDEMMSQLSLAAGEASDRVATTASGLSDAATEAEKLKSACMGFDELNIISPQVDSGGGGGGGSGGGGGAGGAGGAAADLGIDLEKLWDESVFASVATQVDELTEKMKAFINEYKVPLATIGAALGTLGISKLLEHLGEALGLSDGFFAVLKTVKDIAKSAIVVSVQWIMQAELFGKFLDEGSILSYLGAMLVGAISSYVLWSRWGTGGLAIGLGVTAYTALDAVIENGGITGWESAVTALTALVTAIGAYITAADALKKLDLPGVFTKTSGAVSGLWAAIGPKIAGFALDLYLVGQYAVQAVSAISAPAWATAAAILAAIASAAYFVKQNLDLVTQACKDWFAENIVPKLESMKQSFQDIKDAAGRAWEALKQVIPPSLVEAIEKAVDAVKRFLEQIDLMSFVTTLIEGLGGAITFVFGSVIAGAINAVVQVIQGFVTFFSGVVTTVSGIFQLIVSIFTGDADLCRQAIDDMVTGIVDCLTGLKEMALDPIIEFVEGAIEWFTELWDELVGHSIVPDTVDGIVDCWSEMPGEVLKILSDFATDTLAAFTDMWNDVVGFFTKAFPNWWNKHVSPWFKGSKWSTLVSTIYTSISTALSTMVTQWIGGITTWWNTNVAPWFTAAKWQGLAQAIPQLLTGWTSMAGQWATKISSWWNTNVSPWFSYEKWAAIGRNASSGLFSGLGNLWAKGSSLASSLVQGFKDKLGIKSPSRVMMAMGGYIVSGLSLGVSDLTSMGVDVAESFRTGFEDGLRGVTTVLQDSLSGVDLSAVRNISNSIRDTMNRTSVSLTSYARDAFKDEMRSDVVVSGYSGRVGTRSTSSSDQKLLDAISQGVYDAVKLAMGTRSETETQNVNVYLDGKQITASVEKVQRERGRQLLSSRL